MKKEKENWEKKFKEELGFNGTSLRDIRILSFIRQEKSKDHQKWADDLEFAKEILEEEIKRFEESIKELEELKQKIIKR